MMWHQDSARAAGISSAGVPVQLRQSEGAMFADFVQRGPEVGWYFVTISDL